MVDKRQLWEEWEWESHCGMEMSNATATRCCINVITSLYGCRFRWPFFITRYKLLCHVLEAATFTKAIRLGHLHEIVLSASPIFQVIARGR
ncbi:unnamed protein product [Dovyalis caffra]|uniref:Uncharacterized protein n=1 Tax=Dovyalis caffra TaxID=77055 RepID=A0AAV1SW87_9ROSI|nr:unnamed protein product [Dovyalis caffra]